MKQKSRNAQIKMIAINRINILNPRVRNQKVFDDITENIAKVGLKRPITVTKSFSENGKDYDLICGQGRLEAFLACGQTHIPAIVIDALEEEALVMSLVENLARKNHRSLVILQGIELPKTRHCRIRPNFGSNSNQGKILESNSGESFNDRQRKIINRLLDGFEGKLTSSKWAKLTKCSQDTALRDISDLLTREILAKENAGGRSTSYILD